MKLQDYIKVNESRLKKIKSDEEHQEFIDAVRRRFLENLESSKYTQITGLLKTKEYRCCAEGVLGDTLVELFPNEVKWEKYESIKTLILNYEGFVLGCITFNADALKLFIGEIPASPEIGREMGCGSEQILRTIDLWVLNDSLNLSLEQTATYLRKVWNIEKEN